MEVADVQALAIAIARANKHPDPEHYAERVVTAFNGEPLDVEEPAQDAGADVVEAGEQS